MVNSKPKALEEQRLLKVSIYAVLGIAITSVLFGLWSGSGAITFDGFCQSHGCRHDSGRAAGFRLIARGDDERFQDGYWHLEPLVGFVSGSLLASTCAYAFVNGLKGSPCRRRCHSVRPGIPVRGGHWARERDHVFLH